MQLTQYTDYSIRTLLYAAAYSERLVNISEIADYYSISRTHLAKVVAGLTQAGYLQGIRGKNGGLRLSKAPQCINLGELIETVEPLELVECFSPKNACAITVSCQLKHVLHEAKGAFITTLKGYSLADIQLPTPLPVRVEHPLAFYRWDKAK